MQEALSEALALSRVQFGLNIGFHILFPAITIGLSWLLAYVRVRHAISGERAWLETYRLWVKVFALTFAVGVVTGIVMSFQFGTNWPGFMNKVGAVAGPLLAYEVLTAFLFEATFLGVMLFGIERVPGWVHLLSTLVVAAGTTVSAFWILALNSWMQTPAGHVVEGGQVLPASWLGVIFNPSFPWRFAHMVLASAITAAFLVAGLAAWRLLAAPEHAGARASLRMGAHAAAVLLPLQIFVGDQHGLNTLAHQPAKIAAIEALWHTARGAPLTLFALVDEERRENRYAIEVPKGASLVLTHSAEGEVKGLDAFADHAPVMPVFLAFRVMVGTGLAMLALAWGSLRFLRRPPRWLLWAFVLFTFSGWVAVLAGWIVTEVGRQPWLVTGILRTADALGEAGPARLGASLTAYVLTYAALLLAYVFTLFHMARK
ncbi:MAG TPA: cytochrome ubiquinol oxidase subunit I [Burkholderiales bacterium]|nr:cytochrome ubiquinol oxidase subunit I [Burkholderiales bacterium]